MIKKYMRNPLMAMLSIMLPLGGLGGFCSCSDMLDTKSDMVEFAEDNNMKTSQHALSNVMGIIRSIQTIADRTVILGDVRSDQFITTAHASTDLKKLSSFEVDTDNPYNKISDYYAVINNCNNFLEKADTSLTKNGKKVFEETYAVVKAYRAWTYLQLAKNYGQVPLVLKSVLTESEARDEMNKSYSDINAICNYFIDDLKPYIGTELPDYGEVGTNDFEDLCIPIRVLLGEMNLWIGNYQEAAQYFYDYLTDKNRRYIYTSTSGVKWFVTNKDFTTAGRSDSYSHNIASHTSEVLTYIPFEEIEFYGVKSDLQNVFMSTTENLFYFQAQPSQAAKNLSKAQNYTLLTEISATEKDTTYAPKVGLPGNTDINAGDLRLGATYSWKKYNTSETSSFNNEEVTVNKLALSVPLYRAQQVYLMFAEALNRLGYPESAFCVLKYGLRNQNIERYISQRERDAIGSLLNFDDDIFTTSNTQGVHSRGCGNVECDNNYCIPQPTSALASYTDTVQYQIPLVEQMIVDEMGLEFMYEGKRYYDLMRIALRRNDPAYLADAIAKRNGTTDNALRSKLMDKNNWFLPLK